MGWFDKVLKYGTTPGWLGLWGGSGGGGGGSDGWGPGEANWDAYNKEHGYFTSIGGDEWGGSYGGSFADWQDLQRRFTSHAPGRSAAQSQIPGTSEWLAHQYMNDPLTFQLLQNAGDIAGKDYSTMYQGAARQAADTQTNSIMNALSARGGGNLGAAMQGGAQTRAGGELAGLQQGTQMQMQAQDPLLNALSFKFNTLNQIVGSKLGQTQAHLGYKASQEASQNQMWGQIVGGGLGGLGAAFGG